MVFLALSLLTAQPALCAPTAQAHHRVSTTSVAAQALFDEGLTLIYAFNRSASRNAFRRAASADPSLAMAYWGIALSYGPNINVGIEAAGEKAAVAALARAQALARARATPEERAFIAALSRRYSTAPKTNRGRLDTAYCDAMRDLAHAYPDDDDAAALFAESAMDLKPWALYTIAGAPVAGTAEIVATLEATLARSPQHIFANHLYIHATEASLHPEYALMSAQRLGAMTFEAAAAHLVHMPAHTLMRVGDYVGAVEANSRATMHDRMFLSHDNDPEGGYYFGHDLFFLASAAGMVGDYGQAAQAARDLIPQGALEPMLFVDVRFGRWADLLAVGTPKPDNAEPLRVPVWHFARGMAYAATGDFGSARAELNQVERGYAIANVVGVNGFLNGSHEILGAAKALLGAKIAWYGGDHAAAVAQLRKAVAIQDAFYYIEPPDWYGPAREALGGALLQTGDAAGAEQVFRDDLARNPRNPRSLFGLMTALSDEGRVDDAGYVRDAFRGAWVGKPLSVSDLF